MMRGAQRYRLSRRDVNHRERETVHVRTVRHRQRERFAQPQDGGFPVERSLCHPAQLASLGVAEPGCLYAGRSPSGAAPGGSQRLRSRCRGIAYDCTRRHPAGTRAISGDCRGRASSASPAQRPHPSRHPSSSQTSGRPGSPTCVASRRFMSSLPATSSGEMARPSQSH